MPEPITMAMVITIISLGDKAITLGNKAITLGKMTGLIQGQVGAAERLAQSHLETGRQLLDTASRAPESRVDTLVEQAVSELTQAAVVEREAHRQALAYFALAVCHQVLGDEANRVEAFEKLLRVEPTRSPWVALKSKSTTLSWRALGTLVDPQGARLEALESALVNDPGLLNLRLLQCAVADHTGERLEHGKVWGLGELAWRDTLERVAKRRPDLVMS